MDTGLLIVSGGNELRSGAHRGMAKLAARLERDGFPVFRFDRRGVGDSEGENGGFLSSGPDIAEAVAAFLRASPGLRRIVALCICAAETHMPLFHECENSATILLTHHRVLHRVRRIPPA